MNRNERRVMQKAMDKYEVRCAFCRQPYSELEHTYQGRLGDSYAVACSACGPGKLDAVLFAGVGNIPAEMKPVPGKPDHPNYAEAVRTHPLLRR